jgi:hypothetical protein
MGFCVFRKDSNTTPNYSILRLSIQQKEGVYFSPRHELCDQSYSRLNKTITILLKPKYLLNLILLKYVCISVNVLGNLLIIILLLISKIFPEDNINIY